MTYIITDKSSILNKTKKKNIDLPHFSGYNILNYVQVPTKLLSLYLRQRETIHNLLLKQLKINKTIRYISQ